MFRALRSSALARAAVPTHSPLPAHRVVDAMRGVTFGLLDNFASNGRVANVCTVLEVYTEACVCTVHTIEGEIVYDARFPDDNTAVPKRGDRMLLSRVAGEPLLSKMPPPAVFNPDGEERVPRMTPIPAGAADDAYAQPEINGPDRRGNLPKDVLPGDRVEQGPDGQIMGLLSGGSALLKASDLAQIILTQARNLVRIVGNTVRLDTGMGVLEMRTEEGKSTLDLKLGADEATESGVSAENWRIRAELGQEGEIMDLRVLDTRGRAVYRHHVDPDGRVDTLSRRKTEFVDETLRTVIGEDDDRFVAGDTRHDLRGDKVVEVGGSQHTTVSGNSALQTGNDLSLQAGHDLLLGATRSGRLFFGGSALSVADAFLLRAVNGDVTFDVGDPARGDVLASAINLRAPVGGIRLTTGLGRIQLNCARPGGVGLGGPGAKPFHPVMYEFFASMLRVLGALLDSHVHVVAGVPSSPPVSPVSPTIIGMLPACKSRFVKLGG